MRKSWVARMTSTSGAAVERDIVIVERLKDLAIDRCE